MACSIGSLGKYPDELQVKGIHVQNSKMKGTTSGLRIKTWPEKHPGLARDKASLVLPWRKLKMPSSLTKDTSVFLIAKRRYILF